MLPSAMHDNQRRILDFHDVDLVGNILFSNFANCTIKVQVSSLTICSYPPYAVWLTGYTIAIIMQVVVSVQWESYDSLACCYYNKMCLHCSQLLIAISSACSRPSHVYFSYRKKSNFKLLQDDGHK